ncbi:MAG: HAD-IC family P-type ATPase, partial [bacterium]
VDERPARVGTPDFVRGAGVDISRVEARLDQLEAKGATAVVVSHGADVLGVIAVSDEPRRGAPEAVAALHRMGIRALLVTGDNERTARAVADAVGIQEVHGRVRPADKAALVRRIESAGERVAFVGDGINDAPVLASATVGIAIGAGTDVAVEAGDVVLVRSDPLDVPRAIRLARRTLGRVKAGLFWALLYNAAGIPIAAGVLFPATGWLLRPEIAGAAMALSSVSVVLNALSLRVGRGSPAPDAVG